MRRLREKTWRGLQKYLDTVRGVGPTVSSSKIINHPVWPALTILIFTLLVALFIAQPAVAETNFATRNKDATDRMEDLRENVHQDQALNIQTRQETLFNSMIEGLLLLDAPRADSIGQSRVHPAFWRGRGCARQDHPGRCCDNMSWPYWSKGVASHKQVSWLRIGKLGGLSERWLQINGRRPFSMAREKNQGTIVVFHDLTRLKTTRGARARNLSPTSAHELRHARSRSSRATWRRLLGRREKIIRRWRPSFLANDSAQFRAAPILN